MLTRRIPPIAPWNSAGPIWAWLRPLESWPGSPADPGAAAAAIDPPMPLLLRAKWRKFHRELIQKIFQKKIWKNMEKMLTGAWSRPWFTMNFWGKWLFDLWKYDNEAVDLGYILPYLQTNPYVETISGFLFWWNRNTRLGSTALRLSPSSPAVQCVPNPPERIHLSPALLQAPPGWAEKTSCLCEVDIRIILHIPNFYATTLYHSHVSIWQCVKTNSTPFLFTSK